MGKMVYVSSVHAIPEKSQRDCIITEDCEFSPGLVDGDYAKSKATATELVFDAAERGLNASIVFPSGIIGRATYREGASPQWRNLFFAESCPLPFAADMTSWMYGMWQKAFSTVPRTENPVKGYILSGHYVTIRKMLQLVGKTAKAEVSTHLLATGVCKAGGSIL